MEYVEPLNNIPVAGAYAGREDINKMRDLMSLLGNPADTLDTGVPSRPLPQQARKSFPPKNIQQKPINNQYRQEYIPGMNEVPLNEATNYDYNYYNEPQYIEQDYQQYQPMVINEDISFIKNNDARQAIEKYMNRGMNLYSEKIQEIICLDESINSLKKDAKEIKERHSKCKELKMDDVGKVFASQYKETGTKIKILEIRLKNTNSSINEF